MIDVNPREIADSFKNYIDKTVLANRTALIRQT